MKIAIDCRYLGKSGIGRVCEGILDHLDFGENEYVLIGSAQKLEKYKGVRIVPDESEPYSVKGLFTYDKRLNRSCDALIVPNFLVPFGVKIPVFSVMHDLIFLDLPKITTRGFADRTIKKLLLKRGMTRSRRIACVSEFTLSRCKHFYPKLSRKCYVNHIGLSSDVLNYDASVCTKGNDIIFVGNVKEHKGLRTLVKAYRLLPQGKFRLKIIGEREGFLTGMREEELTGEGITFTGRLSDEALLREIASAAFLVQPSLYEGFGLPPLEALYLGTQPIVSEIPVFREVYGELPAVFFSDAEDLAAKLMAEYPPFDVREEIRSKYSYAAFDERLFAQIGQSMSFRR